jgi:predicted alpha/beta hydrolase family esterase
MANAIILHGKPLKDEYYDRSYPSVSNAHWFPWLQKQLLCNEIDAATPEVPHSYEPDWDTWVREVERFEIGLDTILVGHSCGSGFWVRYLSERPELKVGKVILVAPWLDPDGDETGEFFKFKIDPNLVSRTNGLTIFHSDNDMGNVHKSVAVLRENLKDAAYKEFHNFGHFCMEDMGTTEFPELLSAIVRAEK